MLTTEQATERAKDWAQEQTENWGGNFTSKDLEEAWMSGYYAARQAAEEDNRKLIKDLGI